MPKQPLHGSIKKRSDPLFMQGQILQNKRKRDTMDNGYSRVLLVTSYGFSDSLITLFVSGL